MAKPKMLDAIALLKADHRKVEDLFEKFEKARKGATQEGAGQADLHGAHDPHHDRGGDLLSRPARARSKRT